MRSILLVTLTLLATAFATVPSAEAAMQVCTYKSVEGCGGYACADLNGSGTWSGNECVGKDDLDVDPCQWQSDCCSSIGSGFWCPDRE